MSWGIDWELVGKVATISKEVITLGVACIGVYAALEGLSTWKRQLTGQTEYELARQLLRCTYILREALRDVRRPQILIDEQVLPEGFASLSPRQVDYAIMHTAHHNRWSKVLNARAELQTELIKGEVVWNKAVKDKYERLFELQQELLADVNAYLTGFDPDASAEKKAAAYAYRYDRRTINFHLPGAREDPFWIDIEAAISDIESYLKPHLAKPRGILWFGDSR